MLSKRLEEVARHIEGEVLADIGSDHAYLPIDCLKQHIIKSAIAGEVVEGPYLAAQKNVTASGFKSLIDVRLGSGLSILAPGEADCITICGMGGPLIADILLSGKDKLTNGPRLVLQSNIHTAKVRTALSELGYKIIDEVILKDKKHIYEIVVAVPGDSTLSAAQVKFGPKLLQEKNEVFVEKWGKELEHLKTVKAAITPDNEKYEEICSQIKLLEEVL